MAHLQKNGIFIDNLQPWVTEEILWMQFSRQNVEGIQVIKIPRDFSTNKLRGYAICGFDSRENAIKAKEQLNYTEVLGNTLRIALLASEVEREPTNNFIVTNLPQNIDGKTFDQKISEYGTLISSKIQTIKKKDQEKTFGYIQFLRKEDAEKFRLDALNKKVVIGETNIEANVFKKFQPVSAENKNLYFKDYKQASYTKEQLENAEFIKEEVQKIEQYLQERLAQYGTINSTKVAFSEELSKPFAFVCFDQSEDAQKAFEGLNQDEEFHFGYTAWQKSKQQLQEDAEKNRDRKFIFVRNISRKVTSAQLFKVFTDILKVSSIRLKEPTQQRYTTNFATIITEEPNKLDFLKNCIKPESVHKNEALLEIFDKDKKPYITYCFPRKQHKEWVKRNFNKRLGYQIPVPRGAPLPPMPHPAMMVPPMYPMPPGMMVPMPPMMPPPHIRYPQVPMQQQPGQPQRVSRPPQQQHQQRQRPQYPRAQPRRQPQDGQQQGQQQRRPYQQNQQGGRPYQQNQQGGRPYQQNRGQPRQGQPRPAGKPVQYQPKPVGQKPGQAQQVKQAPRPVGQPQQQPQQPQQQQAPQMTIQMLRGRWEEFLKQDKQKQTQMFGTLIYPKIQKYAQNKAFVAKITGMLISPAQFTPEEIADLIADESEIKERVAEAEELLRNA